MLTKTKNKKTDKMLGFEVRIETAPSTPPSHEKSHGRPADTREGVLERFFTDAERKKFRSPRERRAMAEKLQDMPDTRLYASNHVMINKKRVLHNLPLLQRSNVLDEIARKHATSMAEQEKVISNLDAENISILKREMDSSFAYALNVSSGSAIREVQKNFMKSSIPKKNILSTEVDLMGVGSAYDLKGKVYVCQIFVRSKSE